MRSLVIRASIYFIALAAMFAVAGCGDDANGSMNNPSSKCGDGKVDSGEECDDGNQANDDGCDTTCKFSCMTGDAARGCGAAPDDCHAAGVCNDATHMCTPAGAAVQDGQACDNGTKVCVSGVCAPRAVCGDGHVESGEECDDGNRADGDGCDGDCRFSCKSTDATRDCSGGTVAACQKADTCNDTTHTCRAGGSFDDGQACDNATMTCIAGECIGPAPGACGNGAIDPNEQCDDGNALNLDGCDSNCQFEETQRITSLVQNFGIDSFCTSNALGAAFTDAIQQLIQFTWDIPVSSGDISLVFKFLGLRSLTGEDSPFTLGFLKARPGGRTIVQAEAAPDGTPVSPSCGNGVCEQSSDPAIAPSEGNAFCPDDCPANDGSNPTGVYDGMNDLDWWYVRDASSVDSTETPKEKLVGQIVNRHLTAGPGDITVNLEFAFQPTQVTLFHTVVDAAVDGAVNAPLVASGDAPPGHLASEHLDPNLQSVSGSTTGKFCAQVSAASLANTPLSNLLLIECAVNPDDPSRPQVYTAANSVLDVFLSGCIVAGTAPPVTGIVVTQPDGALDGASYAFTVDSDTLKINGCTRNGEAADLQSCLAQATYSSYFQFAADRVIIKRN